MLCAYMYLGHASLTTIRRDFGHEFTARKFPNPPPNSLFTYPNLCLNVFSMLSVACVLAVNFEVYTLTISAYKSTPLSYDRN